MRNLRAAVWGRVQLDEAKADQELPLAPDPKQLAFTFDDLYEKQERRRALDARIEGWAF